MGQAQTAQKWVTGSKKTQWGGPRGERSFLQLEEFYRFSSISSTPFMWGILNVGVTEITQRRQEKPGF